MTVQQYVSEVVARGESERVALEDICWDLNHGFIVVEKPTHAWPVAEAKAKLSEILRMVRAGAPQIVGTEDPCVIVSVEQFEQNLARITSAAFLSKAHRVAMNLTSPTLRYARGAFYRRRRVTAFLLDTNVISELVRATPDSRVVRFLSKETDLWLSVLTLHELTYGTARLTDDDRRRRLLAWIDSIRARFAAKLLVVDSSIAEAAGHARGRAASKGLVVSAIDSLIAASALARGLTLVTRNIRDFASLDVWVFDPWSG